MSDLPTHRDPPAHREPPPPRAPLLHFDGLVPLVVGVAGHRDPAPRELGRIREDVERALVRVLELGGKDGDASPRRTPILVISSLAEGADRLVARVVLDPREGEPEALARGRARLHLATILPMEEAAYKATFDGTGCASREASVAEFDELHRRAGFRAVLPGAAPGGTAAAGTTEARFERMAAFLAWHSHVLLALWNGQAGAPGGTTDSVEWFTGASTPAFAPEDDCIDAPDGLLLLRVPTPRASADRPAVDLAALERRMDSDRATKVFRQIEGFNRDASDQGMTAAAPEEASPDEVSAYRATYAAADGLSRQVYRTKMGNAARLLLLLVIGSVLTFEGYSHVWIDAWGLFAAYVALSFGAYRLIRGVREAEVEERDLVYRSFAEALRVQGAWATAGLDDWVGDHYVPQHHNELEWVRQAMKGLHALSACARGRATAPDATRIRRTLDSWVIHQASWFGDKHHEFHAKAGRFEGWAHAATRLAAGLSASFLVLLALAAFEVLPHDWAHRAHAGVLVAIVFALAGAGLIHQWMRWKGFEIAAKGYRDASQLFGRARAELEARLDAGTPADLLRAQQILRALGASALAENTSWLLSHRDHVLEIHGH